MNEIRDELLEKVIGGRSGAGLAEWAEKAVGQNYVFGGLGAGGFDDVGLIVSYAGGPRNAETMLAIAPEKGNIASLPEIPGIGLYKSGHVGVYLGSGMCVNAVNENRGVVIGSIGSGGWQYWFKISGLDY